MKRYVLALDFGASSGRAMLACYDGNSIKLQEVHRFVNTPIEKDGNLYWDVPQLMQELETGLQKAYAIAPFESIGIDTWGVDYGMLDKDGKLMGNPRHYRDKRSEGYSERLCAQMTSETLYARTGTQIMDINTLFQLMSQRDDEGFSGCHKMLLMPDLFAYLLTGTISAERSIASTTQMLSAKTGTWDTSLLDAQNIPASLMPAIVESGTEKGVLSQEVQQRLSLPPIRVTAVCGHDTQCASFAAPAKTDKHIFLSCGTWSLFGTQCDSPILTPQAANLGLSNEIGYGKTVTFLKNIIGLWLIQESRREFERQGQHYSYAEIEALATHNLSTPCAIDPDDPCFVAPGDIPGRVQDFCRKTSQPIPQTPGAIFRCIYESLAMKYRTALEELERCTGETYPVIHLVGGGTKDRLLCQLTADFCQRPVVAGPIEATIYGNAAIQLLSIGAIASPQAARACIANSETLKTYTPGKFPELHYRMFQNMIKQEK